MLEASQRCACHEQLAAFGDAGGGVPSDITGYLPEKDARVLGDASRPR